jgi:hypothetical protein
MITSLKDSFRSKERDAPETASEDADKGETPPDREERSSWWQRLFGG